MSIEAMKQALDALELLERYDNQRAMLTDDAIEGAWQIADEAMSALRAAIEQSEKQEPVAWMGVDAEGNPNKFRLNKFGSGIPLYTKHGDL